MHELKFCTNPDEILYRGLIQAPILVKHQPGMRIVDYKPTAYMLFFEYASVNGTMIFIGQHTKVQLFTDESSDSDHSPISDIANLVGILETDRAIKGDDIADFLLRYQRAPVTLTDKLRKGLLFDEFNPLEYCTPGDMMVPVLETKGNRYKWRKELHDMLEVEIDIVKYAPVRK